MNKEDLKQEIEIQLENLERLTKEMEEITGSFADKPDSMETRAAGSILHDFYCGVEKIFERISVHVDGGLPKGEDWHTELILRMARSVEEIREAVISRDLLEKLKEYLRFRHLFRHIYGFELSWERFRDLSLSLSAILSELRSNLARFRDTLNKPNKETQHGQE